MAWDIISTEKCNMFKSIKWKLVIMFTLMIISIIIIVGTFFRITISNYYINEFRSNVENAFAGDFFSQIVYNKDVRLSEMIPKTKGW